MHISKRNALFIVEEISKIIGEKINMMNEEGIIIASTDKEREGCFHEAAKELIDNHLQEVLVKNDSEYIGARAGINLAINFHNEIVGVIGVTGPYQEVAKYGQIIKKMTEILIMDQYYKEQKDLDQRIIDRYLDEWLMGESKNITSNFIQQGKALHIDITIPRRILAITLMHKDEKINAEAERMIDRAEKKIHLSLKDYKDAYFFKKGPELLCVLPTKSDEEIYNLALHMKKLVEEETSIDFYCGIDSGFEGVPFIQNSVIKAQKALRASMRTSTKEIRLYKDITMEIFQNELSNEIKIEYILRIFKNCTSNEIHNWMGILKVFYEEEGSISSTAQKLFIHKNTLQYKLNKIKDTTRYDPRSIRYSSLFYNAIHFYQDVKEIMLL